MLSADRQRFLDAVRDSPDDDVPRLVFADWLDEHGDPYRAEFIRGQIRLSGLNEWDDGWTEQDIRCRSLLRQHGEGWLGDLGGFVPASALEDRRWPVFHRGFPERVTVDVETFLQHHDRLFRAGPIRGVWFDITDRIPWKLYECPALARLTVAGLGPWAFAPPRLGHTGLHESHHLAGLTELWLDSDLSVSWWGDRRYVPADEVSIAPFAANLTTLGVTRPPADGYALNGFNRLPALKTLYLCEPLDAVDWRPATERAAWYHTLERLSVVGNGSEWTDGQLADVAGMPGLQAVAFENVDLSAALPGLSAGQAFWQAARFANVNLQPGDWTALLAADSLAGCRVLDVSDNFSGAAVLLRIGSAPGLGGVRVLRAVRCGWTHNTLESFARGGRLAELAELDVGHMLVPTLVPREPVRWLLDGDAFPRLVSLRMPAILMAPAVANTPGAARLRELVFDGPLDKAAAKALAGSPHLDALELLDAQPADRAAGEILRDRFGRRVRFVGG